MADIRDGYDFDVISWFGGAPFWGPQCRTGSTFTKSMLGMDIPEGVPQPPSPSMTDFKSRNLAKWPKPRELF